MNARTLLSIQRPISGTYLNYGFVLTGFYLLGASMYDLYAGNYVAFGVGLIMASLPIYIGGKKIKRV